MAKNKFLLMEHVWLFVSVFTLIFFAYTTYKQSFQESYIMLIFSAIAFLMHLWRKTLRKKEEREEQNKK